MCCALLRRFLRGDAGDEPPLLALPIDSLRALSARTQSCGLGLPGASDVEHEIALAEVFALLAHVDTHIRGAGVAEALDELLKQRHHTRLALRGV